MPLPALVAALAPAAISVIGNLMASRASEQGKQRELAQQREFAQHGIRWRVADAQAAGIHPAVAMGASLPSYSPVGLGSGMAEGLSASSQDISRAVAATATLDERVDQFTKTSQALTIQRMGLENELLAAQIGQINNDHGTLFPRAGGYAMPGQPASGDPPDAPLYSANEKLGQTGENEFGEAGGEFFGAGNLFQTIGEIMAGNYRRPLKEKDTETNAEYIQRQRLANPGT